MNIKKMIAAAIVGPVVTAFAGWVVSKIFEESEEIRKRKKDAEWDEYMDAVSTKFAKTTALHNPPGIHKVGTIYRGLAAEQGIPLIEGTPFKQRPTIKIED